MPAWIIWIVAQLGTVQMVKKALARQACWELNGTQVSPAASALKDTSSH